MRAEFASVAYRGSSWLGLLSIPITKSSKDGLVSGPILQPLSNVTVIVNKEKRRIFAANNLEVSGRICMTIATLPDRVNLVGRDWPVR
jgi:hypothetical protein